MGLLVNGEWVDQWYDTKSSNGRFERQRSTFRHQIGAPNFPAEPGRYHLYVSSACPWAHRTLIARTLKGLEDIISVSVVDPFMGEDGWTFGNTPEPLYGKSKLHEIYTLAKSDFTGRVTVPVLWDTKTHTIVNNESAEILRIFNTAFDHITGNTRDLYPEHLREKIDSINEAIYSTINNGVYRSGFATTQDAYDEAVQALFHALDQIEDTLSRQRYLAGDTLTEADWRLFTTLIRFDAVYVGHFKCNIRTLREYHHISHYVRELYQVAGIAETVRMDHIKEHYYGSHKPINPSGIVPAGPELDFHLPHDRATIKAAA